MADGHLQDADTTRLDLDAVRRLAEAVLDANGVARPTVDILAGRIMAAERDGPASHGLFMLPAYVSSLRAGWVDGRATPQMTRRSPAALHVDGAGGFAQAGIESARDATVAAARAEGVALLTQRNAHHIGALRSDVEPFAEAGLLAMMFVATRRRVVPHGGSRPLLGTNPLAFAAPVAGRPPFVWDMATSASSISDVRLAAEAGRPVPDGTGVDRDGRPTNDATAIIDGGALLTFGGHKGGAIAMMVEIMAAGLTGGNFAVDDRASSVPGAASANGGQCLLVIDPTTASGTDLPQRLAGWLAGFGDGAGGRLPGDGRLARRAAAIRDGVTVGTALVERLRGLC
jgi:delta1-piperideine-2-carboxylate reductase